MSNVALQWHDPSFQGPATHLRMSSFPQARYTGQGSLYLFTLPIELLELLTVRLNALIPAREEPLELPRQVEAASSLGCTACVVAAFASLTQQRLHFRSDWHRYNVKLRLGSSNKAPVSEEVFTKLVDCMFPTFLDRELRFADDLEALDDSLSGSASSDSSLSSDNSANAVSRLMKRTHLGNENVEEREAIRSPLLWMTANSVAPDTQFGFYRLVVPSSDAKGRSDPPQGWIKALGALQVQPEVPSIGKKKAAAMASRGENLPPMIAPEQVTPSDSRTWAFLFTGGGHFAAMIVSLVPKLSLGQGSRFESNLQILAHKTFHRYTTRRKQGGAQSTNDAAKGTAKSVGSQLRRANEAALADDIRALLTAWKNNLTSSELVFVRASRSNSRMFFDYPDAVLKRGDPRIRNVPFSTRRPVRCCGKIFPIQISKDAQTLAELERCFRELTTVKISHLTADALAALDEAELKKDATPAVPSLSTIDASAPSLPVAPKLTKEEMARHERWYRVIEMAKKGRLDALISFVDRHSEEHFTGLLPEWAADYRTPSLLHVAVQADQSEVVRWLLYDQDADPTLSRPAYDLSSSKRVRNAFRRCMADCPDKWDWSGAAHVPSPLTAEQENKDFAREEVKRKAREQEEAKLIAREHERLASERAAQDAKDAARIQQLAAQQAAHQVGPQRLGGGPPRRLVNTQTNGLTEQQRMRLEREQRARAAEARLRSD